MMHDKKKVVGHLTDCMEASKRENKWVFVRKDIVEEALILLKEQETTNTGYERIFGCESCGYGIVDIFINCESKYDILQKYCPNCGRKVKRNDR